MCETDYSGYPDCRNDTLQTLARALSLGLDRPYVIDTPLMYIDKAGTWALARELGDVALIDIIIEHTHSCYLGARDTRHAWGYGCGTCPACELRANGWKRWRGE
jgi:7-cyano-7-deazaguanine synthase